MTKQPVAIHHEWIPISQPPTIRDDGYFSFRSWQKQAFKELKGANRMILNAPMGSGKSMFINALSAYRMRQDSRLRTILAVPQTIIASGFKEARIILPNGLEIDWCPQHDLTTGTPDSNIDQLIRVLERPRAMRDDGVIICTHSTLVGTHKKLVETERLDLLDNLLLWIDEAHHLENAGNEEEDSNSIGKVVTEVISEGKTNTHLGLATATLFRGDRLPVLSKEQQDSFTRFNLPYDDYLPTLRHLRSFSYSFKLTGENWLPGVEEIIKYRKGKDIVYVPHPGSNASTGCKYTEANTIKGYYEKTYGKDFRVLDLVDEKDRASKKEIITSGLDEKDANDAIVALGMFKEGANWNWADRAIIAGRRGSLVDVVQMLGRLFRDAEGKDHVELVHLLPFNFAENDESELRVNLNNYLKTIYASMILENAIAPVRIKGMGKKDPINEALPDESDQQKFIEQVYAEALDAQVNGVETLGEGGDDPVAYVRDAVTNAIPEILADLGAETTDAEEVAKQTWGMMLRPIARIRGIDVNEIDIDLLSDVNPLDYLLQYTSGACGLDTFTKLRQALFTDNDPAKKKAELLALARSGAPRPRLTL